MLFNPVKFALIAGAATAGGVFVGVAVMAYTSLAIVDNNSASLLPTGPSVQTSPTSPPPTPAPSTTPKASSTPSTTPKASSTPSTTPKASPTPAPSNASPTGTEPPTTTTTTKPVITTTPLPEMRFNSAGQYYHFPKLATVVASNYSDAQVACAPSEYWLASPATTTAAFLYNTKELVLTSELPVMAGAFTNSQAEVVWVKHSSPYSDSKFCYRDFPTAFTAYTSLRNSSSESKFPLIRTKTDPYCVQLPSTEEVKNRRFTPLCIRKSLKPYWFDEATKQIFVPKFFTDYPTLVDRGLSSLTFNYMRDKLSCLAGQGGCKGDETVDTYANAILVRSYAFGEPPYIAGFPQSVDHETAKELCKMMRYGDANSRAGQFLTRELLLDSTGDSAKNLLDSLKQSIDALAKYDEQRKKDGITDRLYLDQGIKSVYIPTGGYFDLSGVTNKDTKNKTVLMWELSDGSTVQVANWDEAINQKINFASGITWCPTSDTTTKAYSLDKLDMPVDSYAVRPHLYTSNVPMIKMLPVGIRGLSAEDSTPCLFFHERDLIAYGSVGWIPTCQLSPS